jgi:energy-converting hydrogenase Eha subunit B
MPLLEKGAKTLGREALKTGLNIAGGVVQGRNIKQAAQSRLKARVVPYIYYHGLKSSL